MAGRYVYAIATSFPNEAFWFEGPSSPPVWAGHEILERQSLEANYWYYKEGVKT
jgi:hypothetical protein